MVPVRSILLSNFSGFPCEISLIWSRIESLLKRDDPQAVEGGLLGPLDSRACSMTAQQRSNARARRATEGSGGKSSLEVNVNPLDLCLSIIWREIAFPLAVMSIKISAAEECGAERLETFVLNKLLQCIGQYI